MILQNNELRDENSNFSERSQRKETFAILSKGKDKEMIQRRIGETFLSFNFVSSALMNFLSKQKYQMRLK